MAAESILIRFLVLITILFFVPKIIYRLCKIPSPLAEITIGAILGIAWPSFFFLDDVVNVLGTLGIITLFVYAGIEADTGFIFKNKRFFIENAIRHLIVFILVGYLIMKIFGFSAQISFIVSLALTTPSASYIMSTLDSEGRKTKTWLANKAILGEVISLCLLIILLQINNPWQLLLITAALGVLIYFLPPVFEKLYKVLFSKLVGSEFSFLFVIALISAFITEYLGIHFLIGAFIAGFIARRFVAETVKDKNFRHVTKNKGFAITQGFQFFATTFIPFYFFSIGLMLKKEYFTQHILISSLALSLLVSAIILISLFSHMTWRMNENIRSAIITSTKILPTLVFTFVIASILKKNFGITEDFFAILLIYGVITAVLALLVEYFFRRNRSVNRA